jgi:hypothetical protein
MNISNLRCFRTLNTRPSTHNCRTGVRKAETGRKLDEVFWDQIPAKVSFRSPWIAARKHTRDAIAAWRDCDESELCPVLPLTHARIPKRIIQMDSPPARRIG